ncbi:MAG: hybrid sensor histidine kinase/response regulator [Hyphomicrobiales bacterium]|nr:hybrid sensor histidine kinase/response regulator [Hyphomicrobiales bacterium]
MSDPAQNTQSEDDVDDLFEYAPCGYLSAKPSGRIGRANQTVASWLHYSPDEMKDRHFHDFLNIAGKIYYETHFAPLLRIQGFFNEVALELVRKDGSTFPVLVNAVERRSDAGEVRFIRITVFSAVDRRRYEEELLTARRLAELSASQVRQLNADLEARVADELERRVQAEEALRQAQKMEAIGQLTGGVAHDFNNLLTIIIGGLDTIKKHTSVLPQSPTTDRIQRATKMATHGAERAATLTARLLAFSRRQPLDPRPIDAGNLITNLADLLQRTLGEKVSIETVRGAGLWRTLTDPGELENALVNLAVNARDAMPDGGRLTIETSNAYLDESYVNSVAEPVEPGQYVLIAISDTGIGMDAQTLNRVFEPFFTTKAVGKGTGLGLSQVYGFVRQTGGHISVYSEVGIGTSIKIYLPRLLDERGAVFERSERESSEVRGGNEKILLVEDDPDLREFSSGVLKELGYDVWVAADASIALEMLSQSGQPDLLFTDVVLTGAMNGRELAGEAGRRWPTLKVLYTTGYSRNAIVHNGRLDPGVNLIGKPFNVEELSMKVRSILDS